MFIDSLEIKTSGSSKTQSCAPDQDQIIGTLKGMLQSVGWVQTDRYFASCGFSTPFGFPYVTPPAVTPTVKPPATCPVVPFVFLQFDGKRYGFYDPYTETPISSTTCTMVPLGTSSFDSAQNMADSIIGGRTGLWTASVQTDGGGVTGISIVSLTAGQGPNGVQVTVDGRWAFGNASSGGGWELESVEDRDSDNNVRTTKMKVQITGVLANSGDLTSPATVRVVFKVAASSAAALGIQYSIDTEGKAYNAKNTLVDFHTQSGTYKKIEKYNLIANPYSFGIWDDSDDWGNYYFRQTSLLVAAPYMATEEGFYGNNGTRAFFVVGPGCLRLNTFYIYSAVCLDSAPAYSSSLNYPRILALRSPGMIPLTSPSGAPLVYGAFVMFGKNGSTTPSVVGKLWDMATINDFSGGSATDDKRMIRVSKQDGSGQKTRSSLLFIVS